MKRANDQVPPIIRLASVVIVASGLVGCGGEDSKGGDGAGGEGLGCPSANDCRSETCGGLGEPEECRIEASCDAELACPVAEFRRSDTGTSLTLLDPDAATCIFTALRDVQAGGYEWYITDDVFPGQFSTRRHLVVRDGLAIVYTVETADLSGESSYLGPVTLAPASYFEGCLAETTPEAIFDCLEDGYGGICGG